jgi:hypothetical protein
LRPPLYVEEVARRIRALLGERLLGAWLVGSAALGDFSPDRSDIDIQAISAVRLPLGDRRRLAESLSQDALPCPARGLEFVLYPREDLGRPKGPAFQLNLNTGERLAHHLAFRPGEDPRFWFVIDASIARERGRRLAGPSPASAFPPLPRALVLTALRDALAWYADHDTSGVETVLSACRAWSWASEGRWRSKAEGAQWARRRLLDPGSVEKALRLRDSAGASPLTEGEVYAVLHATHAELDAALRQPTSGAG